MIYLNLLLITYILALVAEKQSTAIVYQRVDAVTRTKEVNTG